MSLFKIVKYSSLLFFLGKYKTRLFRVVCVVLFAIITSLLYQDVVAYLQSTHPGSLVYALIIKILIVYGALVFVLWQFRPVRDNSSTVPERTRPLADTENEAPAPLELNDRLSTLEDVSQTGPLHSRYTGVLKGKPDKKA
ncbi:MAG: hypothetical protein V7746_09145 [Halioglobus sp.]